ncbi:MAG: N-acetylmuramoyl-L-alanine amidase family protein, partial [Kofleriaceae bacterium]
MKLPTHMVFLGMVATAVPLHAAPVVVIDPGHGGSNTGARGVVLPEKQLTLALANQVAERLRARAITVELTRTTDATLTLRQRVAHADRLPADLFVSLHANASTSRSQRGFETFVLSPRAIDIDGRAHRADPPTPRAGGEPDIAR